jgi:hypothetical protein
MTVRGRWLQEPSDRLVWRWEFGGMQPPETTPAVFSNQVMSEQTQEKFDAWALVEVMGRQRIVGRVTEATLAGGAFIRVDVPAADGQAAFTRFYAPGSIYCISPVSEEIAMELLQSCRNEPVARYEIPQLAEKYSKPQETNDNDDTNF